MRGILSGAALLGVTGVALGAFGAHSLADVLSALGLDPESFPRRVENFQTGVRYQLHAAVATLGVGAIAGRGICGTAARLAATLLVVGAIVFSGTLYAIALLGPEWRWLGAVTPVGGLGLIAGWAVVAAEAITGRVASPAAACALPDPGRQPEGLVRLEEVVSHQERLLADLDAALTAARNDIDAANQRVATLDRAVRGIAERGAGGEDLPHERPPHY